LPDIQRIVDEVRFRLQSGDCELTPQLEQLAREYGELCHAINSRLRRCGEFLKQGLRAEAMHLADADPNLLEIFATADFPERVEWDEITALYQLPRAEPLLSEIAEELNEAYALQRPLEKLLDRHRLLALRRAPLNQRLAVMRKLSQADPDSPFWGEDLAEIERARLGEIEAEARAAAARGDAQALSQIAGELSSNEWREAPSPALQQLVRRLALASVAEQLAAAHAAGRMPEARSLREQWQELSARAAPQAVDGLALQVAPALKWIAGEDARSASARQHREALAVLDRRLSSAVSPEELDQARRAVLKHGDLPEPFVSRLYSRTIELKRQTRARRQRTAAMIAGLLVAIFGLAAFVGRGILRADSARRVAQAADQMIEQGNLSQARRLLEQNESLSTSEAYLATQVRLVAAEKKEQERVAAFQGAIERSKSARTSDEADAFLREADRLTITIDERNLVADQIARWKLKAQETTEHQEETFQRRLSEATDALDRLEDMQQRGTASAAFFQLLKSAEETIGELRELTGHVKATLARHADSAESRLAKIKGALVHERDRAELLERLTRESQVFSNQTDPAEQVIRFAELLKKYAAAFPGDPRSRDFTASSAEAILWRGVVAWQQLAGQWKELLPAKVARAKERMAECDAWLREFSRSAAAPAIEEYAAFLKHVVAREQDSSGDETEGVRRKLHNLFSGPLIDNVQVIELKDGKKYYLKQQLDEPEGEKFTFRYLAGFDGGQRSKAVSKDELKQPHSHEAPQTQICRRLRGIVERAPLAGWNEALVEVAETLRSDRDLDPFLRYYLLLRTLEYARASDAFLETELEKQVADLRDSKISPATKWMDPDDRDVARARRAAGEKVAALGDLKAPWRRAKDREERLSARLFETVTPVGWLFLDEGRRWRFESGWTPRGESSLWVAAGGENAAQWVRIGEAHPKALVSLRSEPARAFQEGRLVFARDANPPAAEE